MLARSFWTVRFPPDPDSSGEIGTIPMDPAEAPPQHRVHRQRMAMKGERRAI